MSESARVAKDLLRKSFPSGIDKTHVLSRRSGKARFERIMEKLRREDSQSPTNQTDEDGFDAT